MAEFLKTMLAIIGVVLLVAVFIVLIATIAVSFFAMILGWIKAWWISVIGLLAFAFFFTVLISLWEVFGWQS